MSLTRAYPPHVTNKTTRLIARLEAHHSIDIRYVAITTYPCDYCGDLDALVQTRLYTPYDARDDDADHTEACLACAHTIADDYTTRGDMPVIVEIDKELAR